MKLPDPLRRKLLDATRQGFDICREKCKGQVIYGYAYVMCNRNGGGLQPGCQTEESFAKKEGQGFGDVSCAGFRRYCPDEW